MVKVVYATIIIGWLAACGSPAVSSPVRPRGEPVSGQLDAVAVELATMVGAEQNDEALQRAMFLKAELYNCEVAFQTGRFKTVENEQRSFEKVRPGLERTPNISLGHGAGPITDTADPNRFVGVIVGAICPKPHGGGSK